MKVVQRGFVGTCVGDVIFVPRVERVRSVSDPSMQTSHREYMIPYWSVTLVDDDDSKFPGQSNFPGYIKQCWSLPSVLPPCATHVTLNDVDIDRVPLIDTPTSPILVCRRIVR
jgi:hypothetical protein